MMKDSSGNLFTSIIEALLSGRFICQYSDEVAFEYLSKEAYRENIDDYLSKIDRALRCTDSEDVYYSAYLTVTSADRRRDIKKQFSHTINSLEPMSRWLKLVMSALQRDSSIQPGDTIRQGELLSAIELTQTLMDDLSKIIRVGVFATTKEAPKDQLTHFINKLVDQGYLIAHGPKSSTYTATGKWSYLYNVLEFVHTHENLGLGDSDEEQEDMFL